MTHRGAHEWVFVLTRMWEGPTPLQAFGLPGFSVRTGLVRGPRSDPQDLAEESHVHRPSEP